MQYATLSLTRLSGILALSHEALQSFSGVRFDGQPGLWNPGAMAVLVAFYG